MAHRKKLALRRIALFPRLSATANDFRLYKFCSKYFLYFSQVGLPTEHKLSTGYLLPNVYFRACSAMAALSHLFQLGSVMNEYDPMSEVWSYCWRITGKDALVCKLCHSQVTASARNDGAVWRHMRQAHRDVYRRTRHYKHRAGVTNAQVLATLVIVQ